MNVGELLGDVPQLSRRRGIARGRATSDFFWMSMLLGEAAGPDVVAAVDLWRDGSILGGLRAHRSALRKIFVADLGEILHHRRSLHPRSHRLQIGCRITGMASDAEQFRAGCVGSPLQLEREQ